MPSSLLLTVLLLSVCGFLFAYAIYIATASSRLTAPAQDFLDSGSGIPAWGCVFAGTGVVIAGLDLHMHVRLSAQFGLQYSHVAIGLVLVALCATLLQKRIWLASRITGLKTIGELMGEYFGSTAIRIYLLAILFLFSVPFAAFGLWVISEWVEGVTGGRLPANSVAWTTAFFLFLYSAIGGWRGVIYVVAAQTLLILVLFVFVGGFVLTTFDDVRFLTVVESEPGRILRDSIPGVIQFSPGIINHWPGNHGATGGVWTTVAILSFALALTGIVLSPAFGFLGITTTTGKGYAFLQVWMIGGIAAGALLLIAPLLAAETSSGDALVYLIGYSRGAEYFVERLSAGDHLVAVAFVLMLVISVQIGIAFFAVSGANIATIELIKRYVLPDLSGRQQKLCARIVLAAIYFCMAAAVNVPVFTVLFSSLTLSLSAQLLPAFLGLCWLPWISRSGVLTGLVLGILLVVFTEPLGLILFSGLFVELPWGRWPWTIHSAGWGLFFNFGACLLVSLFTRSGEERDVQQRLHSEFARRYPAELGGRAARGARWSLTLIWVFLALGPGAILGNRFFSQPVFADTEVALGFPSLLAWQVTFWLLGVLVVWWLAYQSRMAIVDSVPTTTFRLQPEPAAFDRLSRPVWISRLLGRLLDR